MPQLSFEEFQAFCNQSPSSNIDEEGLPLDETEESIEEQRKRCKQKIFRLISYRDRSSAELRQRLLEEEFNETLVEELVEWSIQCNLINDQRFAEMFIKSKLKLSWGNEKIIKELERKGFPANTLTEYLDEYCSEDDELQRAFLALSKSRSTAKNLRESYYRKLLSKGFSPSIASRACTEFMNNKNN